MSHIPKVMGSFVRLLSYPNEHTAQAVELLYIVLQGEIPEAAGEASRFGAFVEQHDSREIEEAFTRTFDVNPACALEVGWHLFGEEYARGMFLVRMREELRKYGLSESTELPDHITHVLAVLAAMPDEEAARFVRACVLPAVETMDQALERKETPYRHVIACLVSVMRHRWGPGDTSASRRFLESPPPGVDLLHAFPVADIDCGGGCGTGCSGSPDVVPLEISLPANRERTDSPTTRPEGKS